MRLLAPNDLFNAAGSVRDGVTGAVDDLAGLLTLIGRGTVLMDRAEAVIDRAERLLDDTESLALRTSMALAEAEVSARGAASTLRDAQGTLADAGSALADAQALLDSTQPVLEKVRPVADEIASSLDAGEVDAVVRMFDRLPRLVTHLEQDILPLLGRLDQLEQVGPDVRAILTTVSDLSHAIQGLPGVGLLRRRGERVEDEDRGDEESG